jgi:hypothetical protein
VWITRESARKHKAGGGDGGEGQRAALGNYTGHSNSREQDDANRRIGEPSDLDPWPRRDLANLETSALSPANPDFPVGRRGDACDGSHGTMTIRFP